MVGRKSFLGPTLRAPNTTQLWAHTVSARFEQRLVYSWKEQVPQMVFPVLRAFISSAAQIWRP